MRNKAIRSSISMILVALTVIFTMSVLATSSFAIGATLQPPTELKAESTTSSLTLTWKAAESASGYRIYYKDSCGRWVKHSDVIGTSKTFRNLPSGKRYVIGIKSFYRCDCNDVNVTWSKAFTSIETATAPAVPAKVVVQGANSTAIKISWSRSKGATGYAIYYNHPPFGWKEITRVSGTTVTLRRLVPGNVYTFAVRPYIETSSGIVWGDYKTFKGATAPKAPTVEVTSAGTGKITVKWSKVLCADGYEVYYKFNNGKYKLIKRVAKPEELNYSGLKGGKYTFVVRAYRNTNYGRIYSDYTPVTIKIVGLLPCGCEPVCAYCGPNTTKDECNHHHHRPGRR